jgi:release factor glutamine methyltransferase
MSQPATTTELALAAATARIAGASDSPRLDAEILLAWVLGVPRSRLFTDPESVLTDASAHDFRAAVCRRRQGEPVAYIIGRKEFWSLDLIVSPATLVPRPETETLVEQALRLIAADDPCRVLDLGTGSGAIAIVIASERPRAEIVATDMSPAALDIARRNADLHAVRNIHFVEGNWIEPVRSQRFEVVVSNPPYVCDNDAVLKTLHHEPRAALAAGPQGMDAIRTIAETARAVLVADGWLLLEHGAGQRDAVAAVMRGFGWTDISCFRDLSGQPRVTRARMCRAPTQDHR